MARIVARIGWSLRLAVLALVATAALISAAAAETDKERLERLIAEGNKRYALLVGIGDYSETVPVKFVQENLDAVTRLLTEDLFIPAANIVRIENPDNISLAGTFGYDKGELGDFGGLDITHPDAELFVYYVGHGSRDLRGSNTTNAAESEGYLLATNSRPALLSRTAYSYDTLLANLDAYQKRNFPDGRVVLFMESCFSGETNDGVALNPSMAAALLAPTEGWDEPQSEHDVIAIAAAGADTPAYWDEERHIGLFTDALVAGLSGRADSEGGDGNGTITVAELGDFLRQSVSARARTLGKGDQRPQVQEQDLEKTLANLARTPQPTASPLIEFEVKDLEARLAEIDPRNLPGLKRLSRDVEAFRNSCGDDCRSYLARLILLQDDLRRQVDLCDAAATMSGRWQERGAFNRLAEFDQICAPPDMVDACVASRDLSSKACQCLRDPEDESCQIDPAQICADGLTSATEAGVAQTSLDPLLQFQRLQRNCARDTEALAAARETVCAAAEKGFDANGPIAPGIAACPFAKTIATQRREAERCRSEFAAVEAQSGDHTRLANFIAEYPNCGQISDARVLLDRRIADALGKADTARTPADRKRVHGDLTAIRNAFEGSLSRAALASIDDAISALDETACPVALRSAKEKGLAALSQFVRERPNCEAEIAEAQKLVATGECRAQFERVSGDDATQLIAFTERNRSCEAEVANANARLETLATQCIHRAGEYERAEPREAIRRYRACSSTFGGTFDWVGTQASSSLARLNRTIVCADAFDAMPHDDADALIAFIGRFKAQCPSYTEEAARLYAALPAAVPDVTQFDGIYTGQRGYTEPGRKSPDRSCLDRYEFTATVENGEIRFDSDDRSWTGSVGADGAIRITREGISPRTKSEMWISGSLSGAYARGEMFSGYCGTGYFELSRR
ncbi:caspase family protein [Acuticoccus sediminis]|nr:caspase family protein [Acuticoccus sediminis]